MVKDFNELSVSNVRVTRNSDGMTVYVGDLDDGRKVIARSGSGVRSGNIPTLEIQSPKGTKERTIKIRYTPKLPFDDEPLGTGLGPIDTIIGAAIDGLF